MDISLISGFIAKNFGSLFKGFAGEFGAEIMQIIQNEILEYQEREYYRNSYTKTLLHRVTPKKLKDFYLPLHLSKKSQKYRPKHVYLEAEKRYSTELIRDLFFEEKYITVMGDAGSGKSTLVKSLFISSIEEGFKIPIKIELRYLNDFGGSLLAYITENVFKVNNLANNDRIIRRLMKSGDFIIFLDGYDEIVSTKKGQITKEIDELVRHYGDNCYLLTSRPYTEVELLPLFSNYVVCELSDDEILEFINKQIPQQESDLREKLIESVNNPENLSYKSFLSNPLLLSMFILTFQSYSSIPSKRSVFYSQVFDALYAMHDSISKMAYVRERQSGLAREQVIDVLKLFSFLTYFDEKYVFDEDYIWDKFRIIKQKRKDLIFDNDKLLSDLKVAIGIIASEGVDYAFPHRSLQEYFAALYVSSLNNQNKEKVYGKILKIINKVEFLVRDDNFLLLLSEMDESSLIEYCVVPYLCVVVEEIESIVEKEEHWEMALDIYNRINRVYQAFSSFMGNDFSEIHKKMLRTYKEFEERDIDGVSNKKVYKKNYQNMLKGFTNKNILPFIKSYIPELKKKENELVVLINDKSKTDSDFVDLI